MNMPSIPTDNVKAHLTLSSYNNLLIENNAIKPLTQSYVVDKLYYYHDNFYYPLESGMEFCIKLLLKNGLKRKIEHNDFEKKV